MSKQASIIHTLHMDKYTNHATGRVGQLGLQHFFITYLDVSAIYNANEIILDVKNIDTCQVKSVSQSLSMKSATPQHGTQWWEGPEIEESYGIDGDQRLWRMIHGEMEGGMEREEKTKQQMCVCYRIQSLQTKSMCYTLSHTYTLKKRFINLKSLNILQYRTVEYSVAQPARL